MEYGYRNAVQSLLASEAKVKLFVDSDMPKDTLENWFHKVETENPSKPFVIPDERKPNIYFIIQEMEAWFLKQPECFEKWAEANGYKRRRLDNDIKSYITDMATDVEHIAKPSEKVKTLLGNFFEKEIADGRYRHAKYGKLTTAPALLDRLDLRLLEVKDSELQRFKNKEGKELLEKSGKNMVETLSLEK